MSPSTKMFRKIVQSAGPLSVALVFATSLALAKTARTEVDIANVSRVGTQTLKPGLYSIELNRDSASPEVLFYREGKLVARTPATVVEDPEKTDKTEVITGSSNKDLDVINEIRPAGWKEKIQFPASGGSATMTHYRSQQGKRRLQGPPLSLVEENKQASFF